jgi:hypothetical protein
VSERPHGRTRHRHGPDENGVEGKGCRCGTCMHAVKAASVLYQARIQQLGGKLTVPADPVRAHVRSLMDHGLAVHAIGDASGVGYVTIRNLLYGAPVANRLPSRRVTRRTAHALLDVPYSLLPSSGLAPAAGVRRRLQALTAVGWPTLEIATATDSHPRHLPRLQTHPTPRVEVWLARAVRNLYEQWWNTDPIEQGVSPIRVARALRRAAKQGWVLPAYWDDDEIDNPHATPYQPQVPFRYLAIAENADELINGQGYKIDDAADRLGVSRSHLEHSQTRARNSLDRKSA